MKSSTLESQQEWLDSLAETLLSGVEVDENPFDLPGKYLSIMHEDFVRQSSLLAIYKAALADTRKVICFDWRKAYILAPNVDWGRIHNTRKHTPESIAALKSWIAMIERGKR